MNEHPHARRRRRSRGLGACLAAGLVLAASGTAAATPSASGPASDDPAVVGRWSAPLDIGQIAMHAALMHDGKVLMYTKPANGSMESRVSIYDPSTGTVTHLHLPPPHEIFCSGNSFAPDGRVLIAGGHFHMMENGVGVRTTSLFNPATSTLDAGPEMDIPRWYPTTIELGNGHILVFGGTQTKSLYAETVL